MKKFYSLALAVAAGSMVLSAQVPQKVAQLNVEDATATAVATVNTQNNIMLAPQKAEGVTGVFGEYMYSFHSCLTGKGAENRTVTITQGEGNQVIISGLFDDKDKIFGTYNPADETITIKPQIPFANQQEGKAGVLEIFDWSGESPVPVKDDIVLNYKGGVLSFADPFTIIGVGVHEGTFNGNNVTAGNFKNSYYFLNSGSFLFNPQSTFKFIGDTQFTNNFFCGFYAKKDIPVNVKVYKSTLNGGIFVVEGAFAAINPQLKAQMIIDATVPSVVRVPVQDSGIQTTMKNNQTGQVEECGSAWYASISVVASGKADYDYYVSRIGGAITSTGDKIQFGVEACLYNFPKRAGKEDNWTRSGASTACTLNLPGEAGIEDVISDSENAPVEYFNLQGVKIQNPAEGQIVIRRQGSKVTKVVM